MARIVMTTFGSAGDLNPFLAVAIELRSRGHEVLFAVEENFREKVAAAGFELRLLTGNSAVMLAPYARQLFSGRTPIESLRVLLNSYILPTMPDKVRELRAICADADLLVSSAAHFAATAVADLTGIAWASIVYTPVVLPSEHIESSQFALPLPGWLQRVTNRLTWTFGSLTLRRLADAPVNRIRATLGLPPRHDVFWLGGLSTRLTCLVCSPSFQPPAPDWPHFVRTTGFCSWDTPDGWVPDPQIARFLDAPGPVVAVTAGSIAPEAADIFAPYYAASVNAILNIGARAVVVGTAPDAFAERTDVLAVAAVPYSYLFPRCVAVIHHGGIGTVAQTLRAAVPSVVVPWGVDQFYSGVRLVRLRAGKMLSRTSYSAKRAERALRALLTAPTTKPALESLRAAIAQENGVAATCDALESVLVAPR